MASEGEKSDTSITQTISTLAVAYEKHQQLREQLRGKSLFFNRVLKGAKDSQDVTTHRVRWARVDKEAFEALLKDLHNLIKQTHKLMGDHLEKRIRESTAICYREIVINNNNVRDLEGIRDAVTSLIRLSPTANDNDNEETLRDLLQLKEVNHISDDLLSRMVNDENFDIEEALKSSTSVKNYGTHNLGELSASACLSRSHRPRGSLKNGNESLEVWIEWKSLQNIAKCWTQRKICKARGSLLAQMLHTNGPRHLLSPKCIGFIDDYQQNNRHGLIFEIPLGSRGESSLMSLHDMLGENGYTPTPAQRISLACKLACSILYLHTTNWIHHGFHSGNILFVIDGEEVDLEKPVLSGFDCSYPWRQRISSKWDIYRWPRIQGQAPTTYDSKKPHDIYSLGLLLLEIAHWRPLHEIMCLKRWPEPSSQDAYIRAWLLKEERFPPFKNADPLGELRNSFGDRYWTVASRCIALYGEQGMRLEEGQDQLVTSEIEIQLPKAFTELVVEELKAISF